MEIDEISKSIDSNLLIFYLPNGAELSEAENFEFKFFTNDDSAVLFDTAAPYSPEKNSRILLMLLNGELELLLVFENKSQYVIYYYFIKIEFKFF